MEKYLKLTSNSKIKYGKTLFQMEVSVDCKWGKSGTKSGWIENIESIKDSFYEKLGWISEDSEIMGGTIRGGEIMGGEIWGGVYFKTILQIQGSIHYVNICDINKIQIGCISKTFDEWKKEFKQIGKENNYTENQILEYYIYIKMCIEFIKNNPEAIK